jgi:D-cysteine desulfhydrase
MDPFLPPHRREPLLFAEFPTIARALPWTPLAHGPTAVEPCTAIADYLGRDDVWMKRDDLISPLYGGNKVRRYEFVLADALARGARAIVTTGGLASTQVTATALFGRALGLPVRAVLFDQPLTAFGRTAVLANVTAGAEVIYGGGYLGTVARTLLTARRTPDRYVILPGAPEPLANLGYIDAMLELAEQVRAGQMPRPDVIVLPTGSSGTLAALALGAAYLGWPTEILGVRITARIACNRFTIGLILRATTRFVRARAPAFGRALDARARPPRFALFHGAIGRGYGYPTPDAIEGTRQLARLTGATGEVTYSGKALAGLRAIAGDKRYAGKTILLWNTLSTPRPAVAPDAERSVPPALAWMFRGDVPV